MTALVEVTASPSSHQQEETQQQPTPVKKVVTSPSHHLFSPGTKQAARDHKQQLQELERTNRAAASSLREIDDLALGKNSKNAKKFSEVHNMLEALKKEEELLYVPVPATIGRVQVLKTDKKVQQQQTPARSTTTNNNNDNEPSEYSGSPNNNNNKPAFFEPSPAPIKKKLETIEDAGVQKMIPLPLRNIIPQAEIVSPSKFKEIKPPTENKKIIVSEKLKEEKQKMLVPPGQKHPPRQNTYQPPDPKDKPVKKVAKDFIPACEAKKPSHWPEPEKATRKVTEPGMKFTTNRVPPKNNNNKTEDEENNNNNEEAAVEEALTE